MRTMQLALTIVTERHASFLWDLLNSESAGPGDRVEVEPGAAIIYSTAEETKGLDLPWSYHFVIELSGGITSAAAIGAWIYSRLHPKRDKIRRVEIEERECHLDQGEITRIIERKITVDRGA